MNTGKIMNLALEMAGLSEIPADSAIHVPGEGIERILVGNDLEGPDSFGPRPRDWIWWSPITHQEAFPP